MAWNHIVQMWLIQSPSLTWFTVRVIHFESHCLDCTSALSAPCRESKRLISMKKKYWVITEMSNLAVLHSDRDLGCIQLFGVPLFTNSSGFEILVFVIIVQSSRSLAEHQSKSPQPILVSLLTRHVWLEMAKHLFFFGSISCQTLDSF